MRVRFAPLLAVMGCSSLLAGPVWAQDEEGGGEPAGEEAGDKAAGEGEEAKGEKPEAKEEAKPTEPPVAAADDKSSPIEEPGKAYRFIGLRYRFILVPKFVMNFFGSGGRSVWVDNVGPEFSVRKDKFEMIFSITYADFGMEDTIFKAKDDPETAWEMVRSEIWQIMLMADFMWSAEMSPEFSINYGLGAGLGLVFGDLFRSQLTPEGVPGANLSDPYTWRKCLRSAPRTAYCEEGDPFEEDIEPTWANGGSQPIVFPWLAIQTGLRFKPHRNFAAHLDVGIAAPVLFFFGLGADYGL
jgi:hypothetical protein